MLTSDLPDGTAYFMVTDASLTPTEYQAQTDTDGSAQISFVALPDPYLSPILVQATVYGPTQNGRAQCSGWIHVS